MIIPTYLVISFLPSGKFDNIVGICVIDIQKYFFSNFDLFFHAELIYFLIIDSDLEITRDL